MGSLEKAKEHFASLEMQSIDVPEWDEVIHWRPWNINERQKVWGAVRQSGRETELSARVLIVKALDKDGKLLYSTNDLRTLCYDVDFSVVERISAAIVGVQLSAEEIEKN